MCNIPRLRTRKEQDIKKKEKIIIVTSDEITNEYEW